MKQQVNMTLPRLARQPINHCNLPADILGGLTYQAHPVPLLLDGVAALHHAFFSQLDQIADARQRARQFSDYMTVQFRLHALEDAGLKAGSQTDRPFANYLTVLKGWMFDTNQREGAILKGWVESRFGLIPRWHNGPIRSIDDKNYQRYQQQYCIGLYNTNALEAQLDLLYTYTQYELSRQFPGQAHRRLYRGINNFSEYELMQEDADDKIILLNNLNAFSANQERADEFGDKILVASVPLAKVFFFQKLIPGKLVGEEEFIIIGGLYKCYILNQPIFHSEF